MSKSKSFPQFLHFVFIALYPWLLEFQEMLFDIWYLKFNFIPPRRLQTVSCEFSSLAYLPGVSQTCFYSKQELTTSYTKSTSYFEIGFEQNFPTLILSCPVLTLWCNKSCSTHIARKGVKTISWLEVRPKTLFQLKWMPLWKWMKQSCLGSSLMGLLARSSWDVENKLTNI